MYGEAASSCSPALPAAQDLPYKIVAALAAALLLLTVF